MEENTSQKELQLNVHSLDFLKEIAKWANFLAIIGFIGIGFLILIAIFSGIVFGSLPEEVNVYAGLSGGVIASIYLISAGLYFFPVLYLFRFAEKMKLALYRKDDNTLAEALMYLKAHYKFVGITVIVILSLYVLLILITLLGGLAAM